MLLDYYNIYLFIIYKNKNSQSRSATLVFLLIPRQLFFFILNYHSFLLRHQFLKSQGNGQQFSSPAWICPRAISRSNIHNANQADVVGVIYVILIVFALHDLT